MKRIGSWSLLLCLSACGGAPNHASAPDDREARAQQIDKGDGEETRREMKVQLDGVVAECQRRTTDIEGKLLNAAGLAIGSEQAPGQKEPGGYTAIVAKLRGVGVNPKVITDPASGLLVGDGAAYGKELAKVPASKQDVARSAYNDFATQTVAFSQNATGASEYQIAMQLNAFSIAAVVVRNQKKYGLKTTDDDVAIVKRALDFARRGDDIAGAGTGLIAGMLAVTNGKKPAKVLLDMANVVKASLPSKAVATNEEAKAFLDGFEQGIGDAHARYEKMLKATYGDQWERSTLKGDVEQAFKRAEEAVSEKSQAELRAEQRAKPSTILPSGNEGAGAGAAAGAGLAGLLPTDGPLAGALAVVTSIKNGDAKGAIKGALGFVPPGPIKAGLGLVLGFL
ncbi:MAG: hypothetical protein JWM74_2406 [Myxococcaceae bacterium]|nr:hypothetical protein [Myxococcaceae bacterium]